MEQYTRTSYQVAELITRRYSTSFSSSSTLFDTSIRADIYALYGLVRVADEIVDSYRGDDAAEQLDALEQEVYMAIERQFSANMPVHAFAVTAKKYGIQRDLIKAFFESMRMDCCDTYNDSRYEEYVYGSASAVGLMCLAVFTRGDAKQYEALEQGARVLGSAYQKVNFLRDIKADYEELGRVYFPGVTYQTFDDEQKRAIEAEIEAEYQAAKTSIDRLPENARQAVTLSYVYYSELLREIKKVSASELKTRRVRVNGVKKIALYIRVRLAGSLGLWRKK